MYHVEFIDISKKDASFVYCDNACLFANNMKNTSNFYIRNLMTGLKKKSVERTPNEKDVIKTISEAIPVINQSLKEKYKAKVKKIKSDKKLSAEQKKEKIEKLKLLQFDIPTAEKWFAGYNLLDAVFRQTGNPDYKAFHSHVMQNAISDTAESWQSFFASLSSYSSESGHTDKPSIPGYRKSGGRSTAVFSNLACSIKRGRLSFPKMTLPAKSEQNAEPSEVSQKPEAEETIKDKTVGNTKIPKKKKQDKKTLRLDVSSLPHASKDKLIEVRIVPYYGEYRIQIVTDNGIRKEDILPDENGIIRDDGTPAGVMTLDPGLENLASIADNKGNAPIVIKGGALKSANQFFNKRMASLKSEQMKGHDPKKYHPKTTKQMKALSRHRDNFIRDIFYKYAHFICRTMKERDLHYLIMGHNDGQKQKIHLDHMTNQAFVQIPFVKFISILKTVCIQYGIRFILQEESYTSQASFGARDDIPVYGKEPEEGFPFSGKRYHRGLYRQNDGRIMNADINGAVNTGRKYDERIFPKDMNTAYLYGNVKALRYTDILNESHTWHKKKSIVGQTA